jgi:hypothetical protein
MLSCYTPKSHVLCGAQEELPGQPALPHVDLCPEDVICRTGILCAQFYYRDVGSAYPTHLPVYVSVGCGNLFMMSNVVCMYEYTCKAIPVQAVEAHRVVRRRGSHICLDDRLTDGGEV